MKSPQFPFYASDFLTGCAYLTNEETGIYIRLLCKQWTDGKIPIKRLGFFVGLEWDKFSDELREKFVDEGGFIFNERLEFEREKKRNFIEKQRANGNRGGRPRKKAAPNQEISEPVVEITDKNPSLSVGETQTITQKKPLDIDNDNDNRKKEKIKRSKQEKPKPSPLDGLEIPEAFVPIWLDWLEYRALKKKKPYVAPKYEQIAIDKFLKLSHNDPDRGRAIFKQTAANNWEGFFELKDETTIIRTPANNGNSAGFEQAVVNTDRVLRDVASDFESGTLPGHYPGRSL